MSAEEEEETRERRLAEIEFVRSAYGEDEAWVDEKKQTTIHRRLRCSSDGNNGINVILSLTMPDGYPVEEEAILVIDARISDDVVDASSSSCTDLRKKVSFHSVFAPFSLQQSPLIIVLLQAMDALPSLIEACRLSALENIGSESIFAVLSRADEWISTDFVDIYESRRQMSTDDANEDEEEIRSKQDKLVLGRRLIHSHHIIAQSKRKAVVELAQQYNLGGYSKYG
jgi:hypothetical protein